MQPVVFLCRAGCILLKYQGLFSHLSNAVTFKGVEHEGAVDELAADVNRQQVFVTLVQGDVHSILQSFC